MATETTTRKLAHTIRHVEKIAPGCWEVSTLTEDGHRLGGVGMTVKQAIYKAHEAGKVYGDYEYPE